jgi:hypothetical protein
VSTGANHHRQTIRLGHGDHSIPRRPLSHLHINLGLRNGIHSHNLPAAASMRVMLIIDINHRLLQQQRTYSIEMV